MNNTNYTSIPSISPNKIINTTVDYINKNHKTDASIYESKNKKEVKKIQIEEQDYSFAFK